MDPVFLTLGEVIEIHRDQIERYGGMPGLRDSRLLQSALAMPAATFGGRYLHESLHEMAAAYLFHVVQNHPFVDGNKRTGVVSAMIFMSLNGQKFGAGEQELETIVLEVAQGNVGKDALTAFFQRNSSP